MAGLSDTATGWVTLARIVKTQGRHGEVAAAILTDIPGRFDAVGEVSLWHASGRRQAMPLLGHWFHKQWVVLRLGGVDTMDAAEAWRGAEVQVPRAERAVAPAGQTFISDLAGCTVTDGGQVVGEIVEVEEVPGAPALLHVRAASGADILIPFAAEFILNLDTAARRLDLALPEGLLELSADQD